MRIVQITTSVNWGAVGRIAEQIGEHVIAEGGESYIAYGRYARPSSSNVIKIGNRFTQIINIIFARLFDGEGLAAWLSTRRLIHKIKSIKPDIVHLHNIHGYYLNYRVLFGYLNETDIPVVWTFHDCWPFTGHCSHFVKAECEKWKIQCNKCPLKGDYPKSFIDHSFRNYTRKKDCFTKNNNLHIVTVSDWLGNLVKDSFFKEKDVCVIKNGIDLTVFKPIVTEQSQKYIILGVSSVWTESKGLNDFISLRKVLNPNDYRIVLVGLNSKQILSLPLGIEGIERTDSVDELATLYSTATVFVNPTYADTFPTVNLEALACGTPVITYNTGGSPEAIDSSTGIVVEQGNVAALADAVIKVCKERQENTSRECRSRAELLFDKELAYIDYMSVYQRVKRGGVFLILGVASVWNENKGLSDYIEIGNLLNSGFLIVLVGCSEEVKKILPPSVIGVPRTDSIEELVAWYNLADCVLSLSKAETFGMTPIEAMACGTPVIVYDNTAQPELVDNKCGYSVKNGDVSEVCHAICNIKENGKEYYTDACIERAKEFFNKDDRYKDYIKLYDRLFYKNS